MPAESRPGIFITLEGPDGAGKSTQARLLKQQLEAAGIRVVQTREPGGTETGEEIRNLLLAHRSTGIHPRTEALLMTAARAEHVELVIRPALARGEWVISDRYVDSTYAYQGGGRGLSLAELRQAQILATGGLMPALTLLLDLPAEVGLGRRMGGAEAPNRLDAESLTFHESVRTSYHSFVAADRDRWAVIDATRTVPEIASDIWNVVIERFGKSMGLGALSVVRGSEL